ncbi:MAG: ABC transporter permease [Abditibacteriota bacterium]|nr:ABC transporter permease [Abditibacteriota bacterium]
MNIGDSFKTAFASIRNNKMRSFLTMLGVIIGVGSVISMMSISNSSKQATLNRIQSMGSNKITLRAGVMGMRGGGANSVALKREDAERLKHKCPGIDKITCEVSESAQIKYLNNNASVNINGVDPDYAEINSYTVTHGRFISDRDVSSSARVCVIGTTTNKNIFNGANPIGKELTIKGTKFTVVGLLKEKGGGGFFDPDDIVMVPITTAMKRLFGVDTVRSITMQAKNQAAINGIIDDATKVMRKRHKLREGEDNDFSIQNQADFLEMVNETNKTFSILLLCIASISLVVGGIGIMNIMLVSVTERTREIGIRKALGAKQSDIRNQFLIESITLSVSGGLLGVLLGVAFSFIFVTKMNEGGGPGISVQSILLSFVFAAVVGIFFGWYPARQASRLDPIVALRYE